MLSRCFLYVFGPEVVWLPLLQLSKAEDAYDPRRVMFGSQFQSPSLSPSCVRDNINFLSPILHQYIILLFTGSQISRYVCSAIKSAPCRESARDALCQLRGWGAMFLEGCLATVERDVLHQFFVGQHTIFKIINWPFRYRSFGGLDMSNGS